MEPGDIATFRQQNRLHEEAAQYGLIGLASVARHAFITARMERLTRHLQVLEASGKHEEIAAILRNDMLWEEEDNIDSLIEKAPPCCQRCPDAGKDASKDPSA